MGSSLAGAFGSFGESGAPGFVDPFTELQIAHAHSGSLQNMVNRYAQLGMSGSTPEAMDLGQAPSVTGGIPQQFKGLTGEAQNSSAQIASLGTGQQNLLSQVGSGLNAFSK